MGQSNVGHIVRDEEVASQFLKYWKNLSRDNPGRKHSTKTDDESSEPMDELNEVLQPDLEGQVKSPSIKVIFSPRKTTDMLQWYADRIGDAKASVHYTAAFGVAQPIAQVLNQGHASTKNGLKPNSQDALRRSPRIARLSKPGTLLRYVLLDNKPSVHSSQKREASAEKNGKEYTDYYDFKDIEENRIAFGAILNNSNGNEVASDECLTGLTTFVDYIHTKYMVIDALTDNPLVVTGSANFSVASTEKVSVMF